MNKGDCIVGFKLTIRAWIALAFLLLVIAGSTIYLLNADTSLHRELASQRIESIRDAIRLGVDVPENEALLLKSLRSKYVFEKMCAIVAVRDLGQKGCFASSEIIVALDDPVRLLRREAASAIIDLGPCASAAAPNLARNLKTETGDVAAFSARALARIGPAGAPFISELVAASHSSDILLRDYATKALDEITSKVPGNHTILPGR